MRKRLPELDRNYGSTEKLVTVLEKIELIEKRILEICKLSTNAELHWLIRTVLQDKDDHDFDVNEVTREAVTLYHDRKGIERQTSGASAPTTYTPMKLKPFLDPLRLVAEEVVVQSTKSWEKMEVVEFRGGDSQQETQRKEQEALFQFYKANSRAASAAAAIGIGGNTPKDVDVGELNECGEFTLYTP